MIIKLDNYNSYDQDVRGVYAEKVDKYIHFA